jgi:drug/metabolite transporter (DMT)-like permease
LTPLIVLSLARRILHERNLWTKLLGTAVAFAGVVIILLERGLRREGDVLIGDLLILVAVFAWALYTVLSKPLAERYGPMPVTAWAIVSGTIFCLPGFLIPGAIPRFGAIPPAVWGGILYLSIGTSLVAYPLWMYALRHIEASKVAITTNLQPILTALLSWILFRERFTPGFVLGAALVLAGVTWVETRGSAARARPADPARGSNRS